MRLQKYMAARGVGSRRACEEMIAQGRVSVNGMVVAQMGVLVEDGDRVEVDGKPISVLREPLRYLLLHKPQGVVTTASDEKGRPTVIELLKDVKERVYPVGRLDWDTEGLLILTNDGELAAGLMHPSKEVEKLYSLRARGKFDAAVLHSLEEGVTLDDGHKTSRAKVERLKDDPAFVGQTLLEIRVHEGHNRLIRRMIAAVGGQVTYLRRDKIGALGLGHLKPGQWRNLSENEIAYLKGLYTHD